MSTQATGETRPGTDSADRARALEPRDRNVYTLGAGFSKPAGAPGGRRENAGFSALDVLRDA